MTTLVADPALSDLFRISEDTWTTVSKRSGWVVRLDRAKASMERFIPGVSGYIAVCKAWGSRTFPEAIALASSLVPLADQTALKLSSFAERLKHLPPGQSLGPDLSHEVAAFLDSLGRQARSLDSRGEALNTDIAAFVAANRAADAQFDVYRETMGEGWTRLDAENRAVERAGGTVRGAWRALADDVDAVAKSRAAQTADIVVRLGLDRASGSWRNLGAEAAAFASMAAGQGRYLSGAFLDG